MDRFTRIFELHKILTSHRHPVSRAVLEERLECSRATVRRAIDDLRDHLGAPVAYDRARNGYHYDTRGGDHPYQLPGLWFSGPEFHALLLMDHLLDNPGPGLLADSLAPLRERIGQLLEHDRAGSPDLRQRIRLHQIGARGPGEGFKPVAEAVATRRRLHIIYRGRAADRTTEREVSPPAPQSLSQQLVPGRLVQPRPC